MSKYSMCIRITLLSTVQVSTLVAIVATFVIEDTYRVPCHGSLRACSITSRYTIIAYITR